MNGGCLFAGRLRRVLLVNGVCAVIALSFSCGDDNPTAPGGNGSPPPNNDIPAVPVMTDPDKDPPTRSQTLTVIRKASDFAPLISKAYCDWVITGRGRYETLSGGWIDCFGSWVDIYSGTAWSDGSDSFSPYTQCFPACGLITPYCPGNWDFTIEDWPEDTRFVFMKDDVKDPMPNTLEWDSPEESVCREMVFGQCISKVHITTKYKGTGPAIVKTPYLRRDRFWVATPWQTGAMVERTTGNESITLTCSYTAGSSQTETESFAYSLGASMGLEYKGLKAQVEGSITKTFGTSFTVTEQETRSIARTLQGEAGKRTCFVMWVLVEQYNFVDQHGSPFTDPNYVFDPGFYDDGGDRYYSFQVAGKQYEIGKYSFDLTTNELVAAESIPVR